VSSLTRVPSDMFQGTGQNMKIFGFEYWANPKARDEGFITWYVDNKPSARMGAASMGADSGENSTLVGARIVPEEPMVRFRWFFLRLCDVLIRVRSQLSLTLVSRPTGKRFCPRRCSSRRRC
jgi:hypothetical protein